MTESLDVWTVRRRLYTRHSTWPTWPQTTTEFPCGGPSKFTKSQSRGPTTMGLEDSCTYVSVTHSHWPDVLKLYCVGAIIEKGRVSKISRISARQSRVRLLGFDWTAVRFPLWIWFINYLNYVVNTIHSDNPTVRCIYHIKIRNSNSKISKSRVTTHRLIIVIRN